MLRSSSLQILRNIFRRRQFRWKSSEAGESVKPRTEEEISEWVKKQLGKTWLGTGFIPYDKKLDARYFHATFFALMGFVYPTLFVLHYSPAFNDRNWFTREAYIVLKEREDAGLPLVSADYADPAKLELPSEEELGDTPIQI